MLVELETTVESEVTAETLLGRPRGRGAAGGVGVGVGVIDAGLRPLRVWRVAGFAGSGVKVCPSF